MADAEALDQPDEALVRAVVAGAHSALAALYDRYGRRAYSLARRICGDDNLAEDVVQEVFLTFWREPRRFDPARGGFGTWILTLVHHKSVDTVRREAAIRRRTVAVVDEAQEWSAPGPGADHGALQAMEAGQVRDALSGLPAEQREALALAYFGGYSQREVATLTGVPLGTVKSRMFSGMRRLRGALGPVLREISSDAGGGA
ncbi:RNA polymerase sigma-70 factor (ECF subfamily) [Pseudonocardia hierapolitana]|uniref:RNA polymerase sigma-70 factor (ECF subfamily) n=1 Tax=Pseudonocardia hierapolitana TaxID=1128676 RepID=A0A561SMN5_9PSEU|nr:sigma-70 family RNA polymerase sigma factor [Pseudonocardia hierapolitana]TWF76112.1 RNA polymerase sigma-70 factor (ECF subfamily) [Pseudonocardia hierapolitana]